MNLKEKLEEELSKLSPKERDVIRLRYGIDNGHKRTLEEVGELYGVPKEVISQIEIEVLQKSDVIAGLLEKYVPEERARKPLSNIDDELLNIDLSK